MPKKCAWCGEKFKRKDAGQHREDLTGELPPCSNWGNCWRCGARFQMGAPGTRFNRNLAEVNPTRSAYFPGIGRWECDPKCEKRDDA